MRLLTERLVLRDLESNDAKDIALHANDLEVTKWLLVLPHPYTIRNAREWIKRNDKKIAKEPREDYTFAITLKDAGRFAGAVGLHKIDRFQGTAEMGYFLGRVYHKQGIMYEAASRVLRFAFNQIHLRRVDICAFSENEASNALIRKLGFRYEGIRIAKLRSKADGRIHDDNIYGMLKEDWKKLQR